MSIINQEETEIVTKEEPTQMKNELTTNESNNGVDKKPESEPVLSKNQQKKKRKLELKLKSRIEKRQKEREKRKLRKRNILLKGTEIVTRKQLKSNQMANSKNRLRVVIDCSFENLMSESDISSLCKQLSYCYATNRRADNPLQLYLTDYHGKFKDLLDKMGGNYWDVHRSEESYLKTFENELKSSSICYLTSDSPNELDEFNENCVYIIGGLVDHNHHKSLCYNLALQNNVNHARLPIDKYINLKTRQVLTVNHVFEIISKYTECKNWETAFLSIMPKRKGAKQRQDDDSSNKSDDSSDSCSKNDNKTSVSSDNNNTIASQSS